MYTFSQLLSQYHRYHLSHVSFDVTINDADGDLSYQQGKCKWMEPSEPLLMSPLSLLFTERQLAVRTKVEMSLCQPLCGLHYSRIFYGLFGCVYLDAFLYFLSFSFSVFASLSLSYFLSFLLLFFSLFCPLHKSKHSQFG